MIKNLDQIEINKNIFDLITCNTIVVGTGIAGFNAADSLWNLGNKDVVIITEGINMGTSRNTGSDKQTYYKLSLEGKNNDSIEEMASTLFNGGAMDGNIALVEASMSVRNFCKLVEIGVPFPENEFGEFVGYKTDHDPRQRATSIGPKTSKVMVERLENEVIKKGIEILDGYRIIKILTKHTGNEKKSVGLVAINKKELLNKKVKYLIANCVNIVYATGGPAGIYLHGVYPESQTGSHGPAFEAGIAGVNLTESQYGLASTKFPWNVSGTYQQVIPRYISTDTRGNKEKEFLDNYFSTPQKMLNAIFLKGYQWPFDPRKIEEEGSSLIDILVHNEVLKGRRVFMDFTNNPSAADKNGDFDFSLLGKEAYEYLRNSDGLLSTPIERLKKMNQKAIDIYMENGIDITKEPLEISVCAQHNNGGLKINSWWESNVKNFFPVGEVSGSFGVYRPGGSALNSCMTGSARAAKYISKNYSGNPPETSEFLNNEIINDIGSIVMFGESLIEKLSDESNIAEIDEKLRKVISEFAAHIRDACICEKEICKSMEMLANLNEILCINDIGEIYGAYIIRDMLITRLLYLKAIKEYSNKKGKSRGSYLLLDEIGRKESGKYTFDLDNGEMDDWINEIKLIQKSNQYSFESLWRKRSPIPERNNWFEKVWNEQKQFET